MTHNTIYESSNKQIDGKGIDIIEYVQMQQAKQPSNTWITNV